ncbi:MAG: M4 family metallopeptidase [Oscillospiraceae bacterium]|nr:M4 family metallopeptidase [Oscillospiraceae bacterium]
MNTFLKKISALIIVAGTVTSVIAPMGTSVNASGMSPIDYACPAEYGPWNSAFSVAISKSNNINYLFDTVHNIRFVSNKQETLGNGSGSMIVPSTNDITSFTGTPNNTTKQKLATLYNVEAVYNWFSSKLGYDDFGPTGSSTLNVTLLDTPGEAYSDVNVLHLNGNHFDNTPGNEVPFSMVAFGKTGSKHKLMACDRDTVAHEMSHILLINKLNLRTSSNNETAALIDAYCDIFGELADNNTDWKIGADNYSSSGYCERDLANPSATKTLNESGVELASNFYTNYELFKYDIDNYRVNVNVPSNMRRTPAALGSTVISHTLYLMNKYNISRDDLAEIWYNSLSYYTNPATATFKDCRRAVTLAADAYYSDFSNDLRMQRLEVINNAFDSANIFLEDETITYPKTYTTMSQKSAISAATMTSFVTREKKKYPNGKYWVGSDINTYSSTAAPAANIKLESGVTPFSTFYQGFGLGFASANNGEAYYACAGFARKLQMDYFGTTKYLQLNTASSYSPRIGDHLRVIPSRTGPNTTAHSIFITSVNGNTIQYADCNASGNNNIAWDKTGTISKSNGVLNITLGSSSYNFVWVERPIMMGDINGDSNVNQSDVTALNQIIANPYAPTYNCNTAYRNFVADMNKNGSISSSDLTVLQNAIAGTAYPAFVR